MKTSKVTITMGIAVTAAITMTHHFSHAGALDACDVQMTAKAAQGYTCTVKTKSGPVSWRVEVVVSGSRTFRVFQDLKSGLYVSDDLGKQSQELAMKDNLCASPNYLSQRGNLTAVTWRLPSGYPKDLNGKKGFPNRDSDFVVLEEDGIREVVPGLMTKYFISSSDSAGAEFSAYGYDGEFGGINSGCKGNGNVSLRCVGQLTR